jgi:hypothetical protein
MTGTSAFRDLHPGIAWKLAIFRSLRHLKTQLVR